MSSPFDYFETPSIEQWSVQAGWSLCDGMRIAIVHDGIRPRLGAESFKAIGVGGQSRVRNRKGIQARRPAFGGSDSAPASSTGLAERGAFSDPVGGWWRH